METIFAIVSGNIKSGVAIYRISGPKSIWILEQLMQKPIGLMKPRKMYVRKLFDPVARGQIDEALVVYFPDKASFTGEETVEIYVHGSIAIMKLLDHILSSLEGVRLAQRGEFTRRAFLNGKFDLTAAEGLADLIDAETELQHKQAIRQFGGALEKLYEDWRKKLLELMANVEAYIDFPDEEIPDEILTTVNNKVKELIIQIEKHLQDNNRGERLRLGIKLAIVGKPNVGKSSLMNFLLGREAAIVSSIAGTTRDVIEGHLDIGGYPIILQDTAGIRDGSADEIEQIGMDKARKTMLAADIKIIMYDMVETYNLQNDPFYPLIDDKTIVAFNKLDIAKSPAKDDKAIHISIKTGQNIDQLLAAICELASRIAAPSESPQITRERHRAHLNRALESLRSFDLSGELVLAAEDLRMTVRHLSGITGVITVDEILGEIFSNFCIGK